MLSSSPTPFSVSKPAALVATLHGMATTLKERMALALKQAPGVKPADLARACKISAASVSLWISGGTKTLAGANLITAARLLNVNPEWLGTGRGPMRLNDSPLNTAPQNYSYPEVTSEAQSPRLDLPTLHEAFTLLQHDEDQAGKFPTLLARTERLFELYMRVAADGGRLSAAAYRQLGEEIEHRRGIARGELENRRTPAGRKPKRH